jgi:flagellin
MRAGLGATLNRLSSTINSLGISAENLDSARSQIMDADFASETASFSRNQILQQASTAMLAQANTSNQIALQLLG